MHATGWSRGYVGGDRRPRRDHHAGAAALRLNHRSGRLTSGLSRMLARRGFVPVRDRGRVLADTAVLISYRGRTMADLAMLRDQAKLIGSIAPISTLWRALTEIGAVQGARSPAPGADTRVCVVTD